MLTDIQLKVYCRGLDFLLQLAQEAKCEILEKYHAITDPWERSMFLLDYDLFPEYRLEGNEYDYFTEEDWEKWEATNEPQTYYIPLLEACEV